MSTPNAVTTYRRSALAAALLRMWRGWRVIVPAVIVNALLQALLVWPDITPSWDAATVAFAFLSAVVFGVCLAFVTATTLLIPDGRVGWGAVVEVIRRRWSAFLLWAVALLIALVVATALVPGGAVLIVVLTPFLLLAALDDRGSALGVNFRTIGRRFGRWLVTALIVGAALLLGSALTGVTQFFLRGSFGSAVVWVVAGFVLAWFTVAWGLIYRNASSPDHPETDEAADPDLEQAA